MIKAFKTSRYSTRPTGKKQISNNNETILYLLQNSVFHVFRQ